MSSRCSWRARSARTSRRTGTTASPSRISSSSSAPRPTRSRATGFTASWTSARRTRPQRAGALHHGQARPVQPLTAHAVESPRHQERAQPRVPLGQALLRRAHGAAGPGRVDRLAVAHPCVPMKRGDLLVWAGGPPTRRTALRRTPSAPPWSRPQGTSRGGREHPRGDDVAGE